MYVRANAGFNYKSCYYLFIYRFVPPQVTLCSVINHNLKIVELQPIDKTNVAQYCATLTVFNWGKVHEKWIMRITIKYER